MILLYWGRSRVGGRVIPVKPCRRADHRLLPLNRDVK